MSNTGPRYIDLKVAMYLDLYEKYQSQFFTVVMDKNLSVGDFVGKGSSCDGFQGTFHPSNKGTGAFIIVSPPGFTAVSGSEPSDGSSKYETALMMTAGDLLVLSKNILDNNFFPKERFRFIRETYLKYEDYDIPCFLAEYNGSF